MTPITGPNELGAITLQSQPVTKPSGGDFAKTLSNAIGKVSEVNKDAEATNERFVSKEMGKLHENSIALEKANIALRSLVSVRNKVVDAYRDIMHMNG